MSSGDEKDQVTATNRVLRDAGVLPKEPEEIELPGKGAPVAPLAEAMGAACSRNGVFVRDRVPLYLDKRSQRLEALTPEVMVTYADRNFFLYRPKPIRERGEIVEWKKVQGAMSPQLAKLVLASPFFLGAQREIRRVNAVRMPARREDGSVVLLPEGWDEESRVLTLSSGLEYAEMSVEEARRRLVEFWKDIPFADKDARGMSRSLSVWVAAFLTPFCLGLLSPLACVPMFVSTANERGSGKSILIKAILYALRGSAADAPFGNDEEELRKQLDTAALAAEPILFFDNVKRKLTSPALDRWILMPKWAGRYMGGQKRFEVEKQVVTYVSSNHVELDRDTMRRSLFMDLFIEEEIEGRRFERDIDDPFLARPEVRAELLSCAWALVRHWAEQGQPEGARKLPSMEEWSRVVPGIVLAGGFGDCLEAPKLSFGDPETQDYRDLLAALAQDLVDEEEKRREVKLDELLEICEREDLFVSRLQKTKDGEWSKSTTTWAGLFFKKQAGKKKSVEVVRDGRPVTVRVCMGKRGSKNLKRYDVELSFS